MYFQVSSHYPLPSGNNPIVIFHGKTRNTIWFQTSITVGVFKIFKPIRLLKSCFFLLLSLMETQTLYTNEKKINEVLIFYKLKYHVKYCVNGRIPWP